MPPSTPPAELPDESKDLRKTIEGMAHAEGFDLVGLSPISPPPDAERFDRYLAEGRHGEMRYLERFRDRIVDPSGVLPEARSILSVAVNHARAPGGFRGGGRVARYALGRDYHRVLESMLRRLARRLSDAGVATSFRAIADAGPALERSLAVRAGIGFASKSANLLNHRFGPWLFLGELFLDVEAPTELPHPAPGSCGTCSLCIERCPTGAILEPGRIDARLCISYLTIELRGPIPEALRPSIGDWVFGCDVCSEVCPFGTDAPDASSRFGTHSALDQSLEDLLRIDDAEFARRFEGSPMRRAKRIGLARNAAIALGNLRRAEARSLLRHVSRNDPSEVVRDAAEWASRQLEEK